MTEPEGARIEPRVPSVPSSMRTVMALTWKRLARGRTLWVAAIIALLPVAFASIMAGRAGPSTRILNDVVVFEQLLLGLLPALLIASSIGEDIEDRTTTYLWSRPVARWVVLAGKLGTLIPAIVVLSVASWVAAVAIGTPEPPSLRSCIAIGGGASALALVSAGIATLAPKHGMALTICYVVFFDLGIGLLPLSLRHVSVTFHQRVLIDVLGTTTESAISSGIALVVLGGGWLAIGLLRIRRLEA